MERVGKEDLTPVIWSKLFHAINVKIDKIHIKIPTTYPHENILSYIERSGLRGKGSVKELSGHTFQADPIQGGRGSLDADCILDLCPDFPRWHWTISEQAVCE